MTMFNITDGKNNISRDKPVEHIDLVIGLHVSACTSCTRTMRFRRDIAIDITESVQLLVCFAALAIDARHAQARALQRRRAALDGGCCIGHTGRCSKCASASRPM